MHQNRLLWEHDKSSTSKYKSGNGDETTSFSISNSTLDKYNRKKSY